MRQFATLVLCLALGSAGAAQEPDNAEIVKRGMAATAMVEVAAHGKKVTGSAFCIEQSGYFLTSYDVAYPLRESGPGGWSNRENPDSIKLILNAGQNDQSILDAVLVNTNQATKLVILKTTKAGNFTALPGVSRASSGGCP